MTLYIRGADSVIAQSPVFAGHIRVGRNELMPIEGGRYLFCQGLIRQKRREDQEESEILETLRVNYADVVWQCERLLKSNQNARICVIGSESAFKGSFDETYAESKRMLHRYVETKRLKYPGQQLVCVAPTCIEGSGMNLRRNEDGKAVLAERLKTHPKGRWLQADEVARLVHYLLYIDDGYITNVVIRMNGGEHCT